MDHTVSIQRLYDFINAGDIDGFGRQLADNFVEHNELPGIPSTKTGVVQYFETVLAAFPDLRMDVEDVIASGDKGIPATGKSAIVDLIDITRFGNDGLAREHWGVMDQLGLMQQLGVIPA